MRCLAAAWVALFHWDSGAAAELCSENKQLPINVLDFGDLALVATLVCKPAALRVMWKTRVRNTLNETNECIGHSCDIITALEDPRKMIDSSQLGTTQGGFSHGPLHKHRKSLSIKAFRERYQ